MPHLQCVMVKSHNARPPACTTHCMPSTTQLMRYTIQEISHKSIAMMLIFDDVSDVEYAFVVVFCPHNLRIHSCSACIRKSNTTTHNSAKHFRSSSCSECVNKTHQGQGGVTSGHSTKNLPSATRRHLVNCSFHKKKLPLSSAPRGTLRAARNFLGRSALHRANSQRPADRAVGLSDLGRSFRSQ